MPTLIGIECPICHNEPTAHVAVMPLPGVTHDLDEKGKCVHTCKACPHSYSVGEACFEAQYREKYGFSPDEAPARAPQDPPLFVPKK